MFFGEGDAQWCSSTLAIITLPETPASISVIRFIPALFAGFGSTPTKADKFCIAQREDRLSLLLRHPPMERKKRHHHHGLGRYSPCFYCDIPPLPPPLSRSPSNNNNFLGRRQRLMDDWVPLARKEMPACDIIPIPCHAEREAAMPSKVASAVVFTQCCC